MRNLQTESTRLLCASAFTAGHVFRRRVLSSLDDANRAVAPEGGIDLRLIAQVCQFAERRRTKYWMLLLCSGILSLTATIVDETFGVFVFVAAAAGVSFLEIRNEQVKYLPLFARNIYDPDVVAAACPADLTATRRSAIPREDQNFVVYSGFTPFVGAGVDIGGWAVTVALDKAKDDYGHKSNPQEFTLLELYKTVEVAINDLHLENIRVLDIFLANGTNVRGDHFLLPDEFGRPVQRLSDESARDYRLQSDSKVRCYKRFEVLDWNGEVSLSCFLRCAFRGSSLLIEFKRFVLPPVAGGYREIDSMPPWRFGRQARSLLGAMVLGPIYVLASPLVAFGLLREVIEELLEKKQRERRREIENAPLFDYGSQASHRQLFSGGVFRHYFQMIDADFCGKVLERGTLDCLVDFLDDHGIDTSDLRQRQSTILNSGVIVHGGDVRAESLAVGVGARAVKSAGGPGVSKAS